VNTHIYYIKLGTGEQLNIAQKCIFEENLLWLSFTKASESCILESLSNEEQNPLHNTPKYNYAKDWEPVRQAYANCTDTVQTSNALAIRRFYTATAEDYFFTFLKGKMYYCHPIGDVIPVTFDSFFEKGSRIRHTTGWKCVAEADETIELMERNLSGRITKAKMYRGTICELKGEDKVTFFNTLNCQFPEHDEFTTLRTKTKALIIKVMKTLSPHDFEVFVDMLLTKSGWNRVGERGGTVKAIDMQYYIPIEKRTVYVQVKSELKLSEYKQAINLLEEELAGEEEPNCYLAYHTCKTPQMVEAKHNNLNIKVFDENALAELCNNHQEVIDWLFLKTVGKR